MSRQEFIEQLKQLLLDIPAEEREEAILFYQDYFDEAEGEEDDTLVEKLGSPQKVARQIKLNLYNKESIDAGEYTESGYKNSYYDDVEDTQGVIPHEKNEYNDYGQRRQRNQSNEGVYRENSSSNQLLWIVILVITCPIWGSVLFGVTVGLGATLFGLVCALAGCFFGFMVGGVTCCIAGITQLFATPFVGILVIGVGFILIALSLLFLAAVIAFCKGLIPIIITGIRNLINKLLRRRERLA